MDKDIEEVKGMLSPERTCPKCKGIGELSQMFPDRINTYKLFKCSCGYSCEI